MYTKELLSFILLCTIVTGQTQRNFYPGLDTAWNIASNIWPAISTMIPKQPEYRGYNQGYNYNSYNQPSYYSPEKQYRYNNNNYNPSSIYYTHSAQSPSNTAHGYSSQVDHTYRNPLSYSTQQFSQSGKLPGSYVGSFNNDHQGRSFNIPDLLTSFGNSFQQQDQFAKNVQPIYK